MWTASLLVNELIFFVIAAFETVKCTGVPEFNTILTLLYNFVHYTQDDLKRASGIIHQVSQLYPNLRVIAALPQTSQLKWNIPQVKIIRFDRWVCALSIQWYMFCWFQVCILMAISCCPGFKYWGGSVIAARTTVYGFKLLCIHACAIGISGTRYHKLLARVVVLTQNS